ncbi:MAG: tetratricopeptide repeat protein [Bacteroidia bacterium]
MNTFSRILFLYLLFPFFGVSQSDTTKVNAFNLLSQKYKRSFPDSSFYYGTKALVLAEKLDFKKGIIMANINAGMAQCYLNKFANSLPYLNKALAVAKNNADKYYIGEAYFYLSQAHRFLANYGLSISAAFNGLKMYEAIHYKTGIANCYNGIANVYYDQQNHFKALQYFLKTEALIDPTYGDGNKSTVYLNLGLVYSEIGKFDSAMRFFNKSLSIREKKGNKAALADVYTNMGVGYSSMGKTDTALSYLFKAAAIYEEKNNEYYLGIVYTNIGDAYLLNKNYREAEKYLLKGLFFSEKINDREGLKTSYATLSDLYALTKQFEKAFVYNRRYVEVKDSLLSQHNQNQINEIQTKYETDKRDKEIELLNKDKLLRESVIEKQNAQRMAFIIGIVFLLVFLFIVAGSYHRKQRDNKIIMRQKEEVEKQKSIIEMQKKDVEEKQKEVMDSINYAQRIQRTLLPSEKYIEKNIKRLSK